MKTMYIVSQLIRHSRACGSYSNFLYRGQLLTRKLLNQGLLAFKLKSSLRNVYSRHHDLVDVMEYLCHKWPRMCSVCRNHNPVHSTFILHYRIYSNTVTSRTGAVNTSGAPELTPHPRVLVDFVLLDL